MLNRLFSFFIALLLLIGSSGLIIQSHFCQNQLQKISFYLKSENCNKNETHQCNSAIKKCCKKKSITADNCCHNKTEYIQLNLDLYFFKHYLKIKQVDFTGIVTFFEFNKNPFFCTKKVKFHNYKPPLIALDLQTFLQTFLC